jgi:hypothetical protein
MRAKTAGFGETAINAKFVPDRSKIRGRWLPGRALFGTRGYNIIQWVMGPWGSKVGLEFAGDGALD